MNDFNPTACQQAIEADLVNHPPHYTYGPAEAIEVIEAAVRKCDDPVSAHLHATTLKYLLRLWHKGNPITDAGKAEWYLRRLVERRLELECSKVPGGTNA